MISNFKNTYFENLQKARNSTKETAIHQKTQIVVKLLRVIGFYVAAIFLFFKISANAITVIGFFIGIISCIFVSLGEILIGIILYFLSAVLDHVDGTIARTNNQATFFGRFIDGFFGIILLTLMSLSLSIYILNHEGLSYLFWMGLTCCILCPFHYLFYDRYSSFSRWINSIHDDKNIVPYLRDKISIKYNYINDFKNIIIFTLPIYYYSQIFMHLFLFLYFLMNIFLAIYTLLVYTLSAKKHFNVSAEPHR